ncbi:MAG: hypothetical protein Tsb0014_44430 [Pleurocapsa sp.]
MKLRFLGQPYSTSNYQIETIPSEDTGRFLGRTYTTRRPVQKVISQSCARKYRGVAYGA